MSVTDSAARSRAVLLCAGRGSYAKATLGSLPQDEDLVQRAELLRRGYQLESLLELDQAERFEAARHLRPANVSPLIYVRSMLDVARAEREHTVIAVGGNSMGWYTALAAAGALSFEDGYHLVQRMALLQEAAVAGIGQGGQVLYPVVDEHWRPDPARAAAVEAALAGAAGEAFPSIRLGGFRVLAGSNPGITHLLRALPQVEVGRLMYPFRLAQHGPYHTALAAPVSFAAGQELAQLEFRAPRVTLIDGRGRRHSPWSVDLDELRNYTLGAQVTTPYDFTASVRVALREFAPDRLVLPGPGNTLGGICGQILCEEGWRGVHTKADFGALQASETPVVESMDLR